MGSINRSRRKVLELLGVAAATPLIIRSGWVFGADKANVPSCIVRPRQTEGPYFVDERLDRSDIRSDPSDGSIRPGIPLQLTINVSRITPGACAPFKDALVDVWHCDAAGVYSDVDDMSTTGKKFLRGYQVTDVGGKAEFMTIYPGWYPGRTVHIHFKIRTDFAARRGHSFTSQLYFYDAFTDRVHAQPPYAANGQRDMRNEDDMIFRDGGDQLILKPVKKEQGYAAVFDVGVQID